MTACSDSPFYNYKPSLIAAIIFCVCFGLTTILHIVQMFRARVWYMAALMLGGILEIIGYSTRAVSASQEYGCWTFTPFAIQTLTLLIAPALFAASIYMILGRIIVLTGREDHSFIGPDWLTKIFVLGDVFSFIVQIIGGIVLSNASKNPSKMQSAEDIILVGLGIQLVFFGLFVIAIGTFHLRMRRRPTERSQDPEIRWEYYLTTLYFVSTLVLIRSIFRLLEYVSGNGGYLLTHEAFLYIFDALLMFLMMAWMNWSHPMEIGILLRGEHLGDGHPLKLFSTRYMNLKRESDA